MFTEGLGWGGAERNCKGNRYKKMRLQDKKRKNSLRGSNKTNDNNNVIRKWQSGE